MKFLSSLVQHSLKPAKSLYSAPTGQSRLRSNPLNSTEDTVADEVGLADIQAVEQGLSIESNLVEQIPVTRSVESVYGDDSVVSYANRKSNDIGYTAPESHPKANFANSQPTGEPPIAPQQPFSKEYMDGFVENSSDGQTDLSSVPNDISAEQSGGSRTAESSVHSISSSQNSDTNRSKNPALNTEAQGLESSEKESTLLSQNTVQFIEDKAAKVPSFSEMVTDPENEKVISKTDVNQEKITSESARLESRYVESPRNLLDNHQPQSSAGSNETPQVRIGHINVLVNEQTANIQQNNGASSTSKSANGTRFSSFGLKGL